MKATQFFLLRARSCGASAAARPSTACAPSRRRVRADHRDEQPRRGPPEDEPRTYRNKSYPAPDAGDHGRLDHAHPHRHRADLRGVCRQGQAGARRPARSVQARSAGIPAGSAGVEPGDIILSIDGDRRTTPTSSSRRFARHQPGDTVDVVLERDGVSQMIEVDLGTNPTDGTELRHGLPRCDVRRRHRVAVDGDRRGRRHEHHRSWADGVAEPSAASSRSSTRSTSSTTCRHERRSNDPTDDGRRHQQFSASIGDETGFGGPLPARRRQRVRRLAQHVPCAAVRRWPRGDRHLRAVPRARRPALPRRRHQDDAGGDGVIAVLAMLFVTGLYLDFARPLK